MKNKKYVIPFVLVLGMFVLVAASCGTTDTNENTNAAAVINESTTNTNTAAVTGIKNVSVSSGDTVTSPLTVTGEALGTWYFEASLPIELVDSQGDIIVQGAAQAQGDWMVETFVEFEATLTFTTDDTSGTLILSQDDPSGLFEVETLSIPVNF